jgi:DNA-binding transcriptional regulator GbsR (MarR family)
METLTPVQQKFVLHWGEMGNKWGINRTVAHIHALLLLSETPLHAEQISQLLSVARSNVSNSIRELLSWEIIRPVHVLGDRREHYESLKDIWEIFWIIAEKRKRREVDPTLAAIRECIAVLNDGPLAEADRYTLSRLEGIEELAGSLTACFEQTNQLPMPVKKQLILMDNRIEKVLGFLGIKR